MAAKKDKMIPSEKERKRALKYATPAGTGRMWVTMGIAFIIFGIKSYGYYNIVAKNLLRYIMRQQLFVAKGE